MIAGSDDGYEEIVTQIGDLSGKHPRVTLMMLSLPHALAFLGLSEKRNPIPHQTNEIRDSLCASH